MGAHPAVPLIAAENFILATRDSGYRSTAAAVAEIIDNSLQAGATDIAIAVQDLKTTEGRSVELSVLDNGKGMNVASLRTALRFGGTDRFNSREGSGRFGMGLPNSSVSQARRLDVFTWQQGRDPFYSYIDVDEIASGDLQSVPEPRQAYLPAHFAHMVGKTGTLVRWTRCDRIGFRKAVTIAQKLRAPLGRIFRYSLWKGVRITVNGTALSPIDPLFLRVQDGIGCAIEYCAPLEFEVRCHGVAETARVVIRFSELPIAQWGSMPVEERRRMGIINGAGVSVVRASREVAYGWHFMGQKRRENYDDWWRCEVQFDPRLDELLGVTHSKQDVNPRADLLQAVAPDVEGVARTLNSRVRATFSRLKARAVPSAGAIATARDKYLPPIAIDERRQAKRNPIEHEVSNGALATSTALRYFIRAEPFEEATFFRWVLRDMELEFTLNENHAFYRLVYKPLIESSDTRYRYWMDVLLLAAARAEAARSEVEIDERRKFLHKAWSEALAVFLEN